MNIKFFATVILSGMILFSGCGTQKRLDTPVKKSVPSWYVNQPGTTSTTLYSVGEGQDKEAAVMNALGNMVSTLSVSFSSQYSSKEVIEEGVKNTRQLTASSEIQSDVKKIRISNYELLEHKELGFRQHIVLIKSDKQKLFNSLKSELEQKFDLIDKEKDALSRYHALKQLLFYKKAKMDISDVPNTLVVMNVLNDSFDGRPYLTKVSSVNSQYDRLLSEISFSVKSNGDAKGLESSIINGLNDEKLQVRYATGKKHFILTVTSKTQEASSHGFTIARTSIDISVRDYRGSVIGSNKLNLIGQSTQGYEIAKESVAVKLNEMIKKEGISKVIGLDL